MSKDEKEKECTLDEAIQGADFMVNLLKGGEKLKATLRYARRVTGIVKGLEAKQATLERDIDRKEGKSRSLDADNKDKEDGSKNRLEAQQSSYDAKEKALSDHYKSEQALVNEKIEKLNTRWMDAKNKAEAEEARLTKATQKHKDFLTQVGG